MSAYDLNASYQNVTRGFRDEAIKTLRSGLSRIEHCAGQLTDQQIWWRPRPEMNAIGNLLLHLSGNVGQWIISTIENTPSDRNRPAEFAQRDLIPSTELLKRLRETVERATQAIGRLTEPLQLLEPRRVQGHDTCILAAVFHSVCHFEGHAQEIVCLTRQLLGDQYKFQWVPVTPEQTSGNRPSK
jgi:hypothetical protein